MDTRSHGSSRSYVSGSITNLRVVVCIYIIMGSLACGVCIILCFGIPSQHTATRVWARAAPLPPRSLTARASAQIIKCTPSSMHYAMDTLEYCYITS